MNATFLEVQTRLLKEPQDLRLWLSLGLHYERLGDLDQAYQSYRQLAFFHPSSATDTLLESVASKWPLSPDIQQAIQELDQEVNQFRIAQERLLQEGPRSVSNLLQELENPQFKQKERLIIVLGRIKDPRAVLPLLKHFPSYPYEVLQALRNLKDSRCILPLIQHYPTLEDPFLKCSILRVLGQFSQETCLEFLLQRGWEEEHPHLRLEARECLEKLVRTDSLLPTLHLTLKHPNPSIRLGTLWTLARSPDLSIFPLILQGLQDSSLSVRRAAIAFLGKGHFQEAIPLLQEKFLEEPELYPDILEAFGKMAYLPPLLKALGDPDPWKKFLGARLLFCLGKTPGRIMLELLAQHSDRRLSWAAKQTLKWG
jgi:HEAT repeat protein